MLPILDYWRAALFNASSGEWTVYTAPIHTWEAPPKWFALPRRPIAFLLH
jgi:hypothetical protein